MQNTKTIIDKTKNNRLLNALLQFYCIFLPFEEAFASSVGSVQRILSFLIILIILFTHHFRFVFRKEHVLLAIWLLFCLLSFIWASDKSSWSYFIRIYAYQISFVLIVIGIDPNLIDLHGFRKSLIIGAIIAALIICVFSKSSTLTNEGRRSVIVLGRVLDPNIVAANMSLGIISAIGEYIEEKVNRVKLFYLAASGIILLGVFFTGSRGILIAMIVGITSLIYSSYKEKEYHKQVRKILFVGVIVVIIIISILPQELLSARFSKDTFLGLNEYKAGVHNRYTIWYYALQLFSNNFFIGYGCGNFINSIATLYRSAASHNLYLLLLVENGLVGFSVFTGYLFSIYKRINSTKNYIARAMLITIIISGLSLDAITYKYFWLTILYISVCITQATTKKPSGKL